MNMNKRIDYEKKERTLYELRFSIHDLTKEIQKSNNIKFVLKSNQVVEELLEEYEFFKSMFDDRAEEYKEVIGIIFDNYYDTLKLLIFELKMSLKASTNRLEDLKICRACGHEHKELVRYLRNMWSYFGIN